MLGVVGALLPRRHRQAIARASVSALVASLPLLYVSLRRPPPAALAGDTAFWFLMSNCVVAAIVATADDAGTLFFGSSNDDDDPRDNDHHASSRGVDAAVVPFVAVNDDPAPALTMEAGSVVQEEAVVASTVPGTGSNPVDIYLVPVLQQRQRGEQHDAAAMEPSTDKNITAVTMAVEGQGEEGESAVLTPAASDDRALAAEPPETETTEPEPEAWVPKLVTSRSLPEQEVQGEDADAADEEWPVALYPRPPDVVPHDSVGRLRRWATDGSKSSVAAEESEYWKLSDEELNRRVEDFIARFNRQIEQEAGV